MNLKILPFLLFLCVSCINKDKPNKVVSNEENFINTFQKLSPTTDFSTQKIVLIIPFDGCSSCFEKAISLISEVKKNEGLIIMPCLQKRRVYNFIEENAIDLNSVIIVDTLQLTVKNGLIDINPKIYVVESDRILFSKLVEELDINSFQSKFFKY